MARRNSEQSTEWEGELYRLLAENVKDYAIFVLDAQRRVQTWTPGAERLLGFCQEEILGQPADLLFTPEDVEHDIPQQELDQARSTGRGEDDRWHVRKDGTRFWGTGVVTPLWNESGELRGFAKIIQDRTEWKQAEAGRLASEASKAAVLETALDAIITIDHEDHIVEFNPAAEQLFGYRRSDVLGHKMAELILPDHLRERHYRGLEHYLATGQGTVLGQRIELTAQRADGTEIPVELAIVRVPTHDAIYFTGYLRDITPRKKQEQRRAAQLAVTEVLAEAPTLEEAAFRILQRICKHLDWDVGGFWLVDEQANVLRCQQTWHLPSVEVAAFEKNSRETTFAAGVGLPGRTWSSRQPHWIADVSQDDDFPRLASAVEVRLHAAFAVPLTFGTRVLGVIEFLSDRIEKPDSDLLDVMATVGGQIGQFIQRKRAEESLRASEERFRGIVSRSIAGVAEVDLTGRFLFANDRYCEIVGRSLDELRQLRMQDISHKDDLKRNVPLFEQIVRDAQPYTIEKRYIRPDGSQVWVNNSVSGLRGPDNRVNSIAAVCVDVTARRSAEDALWKAHRHLERRVEERTTELSHTNRFLRALLESIHDGIVACNARGELTFFNRAAIELHALPQQPTIPGDLPAHHELFHPDGTAMAENEVPLLRAFNGEIVESVEMVVAPKNGVARTLLASGRAFFDERGNNLGAVVSMRDISERKVAENALRRAHQDMERRVAERTTELARANEALLEADRRKDEFLAMLAHELRNPLAPIRSGLDILRLTDEGSEVVETMQQQVEHLVRLVDDLLDVSRIMRGKIELRRESVDLASVVARAVETVRPVIDSFEHQLDLDLPSESTALYVDPVRMSQMIGNLLNNAAKYTPRGGHISLKAKRKGNELTLSIRDTGMGIGEDLMPRIFDLFQQGKQSMDRSHGGLGIGLTLVKNLTEMHGGRISVQSDGAGRGSEFVIVVPAFAPRQPSD